MGNDFVERWGEILDTFKKEGVKFAHEPHPNEYVYNVETALKSVELMGGRPEWGFNFDPANIVIMGIDPVIFVQELGDRIYHAHAKDGEVVGKHEDLAAVDETVPGHKAVSRRPGISEVLSTEKSSVKGLRIRSCVLRGSSDRRPRRSQEVGEVKV